MAAAGFMDTPSDSNQDPGERPAPGSPSRGLTVLQEDRPPTPRRTVSTIHAATILFAGDSGDGMQLTGTQFSDTSALVGNDISTLPDYPAEIRAPAGTLAGVSGFQLQFSDSDIYTRGGHHHRQSGRLFPGRFEKGRVQGQSPPRRLAGRLPLGQRPH